MTDPLVEAARRTFGPRFIAAGVDPVEFERTTARVERWAEWLDAWAAVGQAHEDRAAVAEARGRRVTAGEASLRAALAYHFAKFIWLEDPARYRVLTDRSIAAHRRALGLLDPTFERLEIPFDGDRIVANVRRPAGVARPPVVILVPGLDSTKEEFAAWERSFLDRGLATAALDGPGQGEGGFVHRIRPDYEVPVAALLDALDRRSDLDPRRVGISGIGLGAYYATRAAAFEPRIAAAGVVGGAYRFARMPELTRRKFMYSAQAADADAAAAYGEGFTLDGVGERVAQPLLVIHGRHDAVLAWEDAERTARRAPRSEFKLYDDGNTVCSSVSVLYRPYLADWIRERV